MRVIKKLLSNYNWFLTLGEVSPVMEMSVYSGDSDSNGAVYQSLSVSVIETLSCQYYFL